MTALRKPEDYITIDEYLYGEDASDVRHEYCNGEVYAMAGGTSRHNAAALYFASRIDAHTENGPCQVFMADFKVRVQFIENDLFYYPDVFVACEPDDTHSLYREKPKFWLEVISESNTNNINRDRVEKTLIARRIPSVEEFVLVSSNPDRPEISIFRRENDWDPPEVVHEGEVEFRSLGLTISVDALYERLSRIPMD